MIRRVDSWCFDMYFVGQTFATEASKADGLQESPENWKVKKYSQIELPEKRIVGTGRQRDCRRGGTTSRGCWGGRKKGNTSEMAERLLQTGGLQVTSNVVVSKKEEDNSRKIQTIKNTRQQFSPATRVSE